MTTEPEDNKRLRVVGEELPAPPAHGEGSPRHRTLKRLGYLSAAAATAAGALLLARCTGVAGYGVVDPLPVPPRCPGVAATVRVTATWTERDTILVVFEASTAPGTSYLSQQPHVEAGELKRWQITPERAELEIAVTPDGRWLMAVVQVDCPSQGVSPGSIGAQIRIGEPASATEGPPPRPTLSVSGVYDGN
jgi:hypothetical protein